MYGLIGKMIAVENQRDALIDIILRGIESMPGCLSYIVARDAADGDTIWITEVWDSKSSHEASLSLPTVRASIERAMPLVAGFEVSIVTEPVRGSVLQAS